MQASALDTLDFGFQTTQLTNPYIVRPGRLSCNAQTYTVLFRFFQITYTSAVSNAAIPLRSIHIGFSCQPGTAGRVAAVGVSGLVESAGAVALIADEAFAAWDDAAKPIPDTSNAATSRTSGLPTACSTRSPWARSGLVKAAADDGLEDMEGGCMTAKFLIG